jgi:hypothetical protein
MDTITDVAWFYSSLAQAAASIVGIVGAVFLTQLMAHRARMLQEREDLATRLGDYGLNTFAERVKEYTDPAYLAMQHITTPADDQALRDGAAALSRLLRRRVEPGTLAAIERRLGEYEQQASGAWAKGQLHQNAAHLGLLRRKVELFQARVLPPALIVEWVLLTWLSIFGMLWPLAVLPARPQWIVSKGLILTCFAVGVLGFVVYLAYELEQLRRLGQFEWTKED